MAKIEMDLSEFQLMEKNKQLLEKAIEREKGITAERDEAIKEKEEALKSAKMQVVKTRNVITTAHAFCKRDPREAMKSLLNLIGFSVDYRINDYLNNANFSNYEKLLDTFFEFKESSYELTEDVTVVGLDSIKSEIRESVRKEVEKKVEKELKELNTLRELQTTNDMKFADLKNKNEIISLERDALNHQITQLLKEIKEKGEFITRLHSEGANNHEALVNIRSEVMNCNYIFGKGRTLKNINTYLNNVKS